VARGSERVVAAAPATDPVGFAEVAPTIAIMLLALYAARLSELVPALAPLRPTLLLALVGAGWVLLRSSEQAAHGVLSNPIFRLLLLYGALAVAMAPFAIWPKHALMNAVSLFGPAILLSVILLLSAPTSKNLDKITYGFVCAVLIHLVYVSVSGRIRGENRLGGTDSLDPNDLAALAAMAFPFALGHAARRRGIGRIIPILGAVMMVITLLRSGSRGGTLAFVTCAVIYAAGQPGVRRLKFALAFVVGGAAAWSFGPPEYRTRMMTMLSLEEDYNTFAYEGRNLVRQRAREYFLENPVTGVGLANFEAAEGRRLRQLNMAGKWSAPHNAYWQAFAELGFFGGVTFLALLLAAGRAGMRLWRPKLRSGAPNPIHRPEFLAALTSFAIAAYFLSHAYFWAMFGLVGLLALGDGVIRRALPRPNEAPAVPVNPAGMARAGMGRGGRQRFGQRVVSRS
jgi:O-antigen ligase